MLIEQADGSNRRYYRTGINNTDNDPMLLF
jgi:hypothetical protein